jgi:hypothetical protein
MIDVAHDAQKEENKFVLLGADASSCGVTSDDNGTIGSGFGLPVYDPPKLGDPLPEAPFTFCG